MVSVSIEQEQCRSELSDIMAVKLQHDDETAPVCLSDYARLARGSSGK